MLSELSYTAMQVQLCYMITSALRPEYTEETLKSYLTIIIPACDRYIYTTQYSTTHLRRQPARCPAATTVSVDQLEEGQTAADLELVEGERHSDLVAPWA